jgi:hypothetical protein
VAWLRTNFSDALRGARRCRRQCTSTKKWQRSTTGRYARKCCFKPSIGRVGYKSGVQALLYNAVAVCHMKMGNYAEAESALLEAFNKSPRDPDTLANLITCGLHVGKSVVRYTR